MCCNVYELEVFEAGCFLRAYSLVEIEDQAESLMLRDMT